VGILSDEQYSEFIGKMESASADPEPETAAEQPEVQDTAPESSDDSVDVKPEEDGSSETAADVKEEVEAQAESSESDDAPKTPEHIPYSRFKEVNDKFRAREDDLQQARERITALEQLTLKQSTPAEPEKSADDAWLEELFGADADDPSAQALKQMRQDMKSVQDWQQQRTEQIVATQLKTEIESAVDKNPDVKAEELWQAVAANGSVDITQAAEAIQQHRQSMRDQFKGEAAAEIESLKAKIAEMEKTQEEASSFRRPSSTATAPPAPERKGFSVAQATAAFAEAIRERASN